jgi:hypothetical protein
LIDPGDMPGIEDQETVSAIVLIAIEIQRTNL